MKKLSIDLHAFTAFSYESSSSGLFGQVKNVM